MLLYIKKILIYINYRRTTSMIAFLPLLLSVFLYHSVHILLFILYIFHISEKYETHFKLILNYDRIYTQTPPCHCQALFANVVDTSTKKEQSEKIALFVFLNFSKWTIFTLHFYRKQFGIRLYYRQKSLSVTTTLL